jgi:hypothetical protein
LFSACSKEDENPELNRIKKTGRAETETEEYKSENPADKDTSLFFIIGNTGINIIKYSGKPQNYILLNVHENETTSINAAADVSKKHGGEFLYLHSTGDRNISFELEGRIYTFDPNRIFTLTGIKKTLENLGNYSKNAESEVNNLAEFILSKIIKDSKYIIAVHNNTDGSYAADSYYGEYKKDGKKIYLNKSEDYDDFFFVTNDDDFEYLKSKGYNVILQDNDNVRDDGSLSVYCGKNGIPYINVETQNGKYAKQHQMIEIIVEKIINE